MSGNVKENAMTFVHPSCVVAQVLCQVPCAKAFSIFSERLKTLENWHGAILKVRTICDTVHPE